MNQSTVVTASKANKKIKGSVKETAKANTGDIRTSKKWAWSLGAIFTGLMIGFILILATGDNPGDYVIGLWKGTFGSWTSFGNFLGVCSWLIFVGLAMMVSFRAKLFNIGIAGQFIGGGLAGYLTAVFLSIGRVGFIFSIIIPVTTGVLIGWLIGYLKTRFNIHEVVSSIMFNWSVFYIYKHFTNQSNTGDWLFSGTVTKNINPDNSLRMDLLSQWFPNSTVNMMIIFAIIAVVVIWYLYKYSKWGVKQDIIGNNAKAADYVGINRNKEIMKTMAISGGLAGAGGAAFYLGVNQNLPFIGADIPGQAFNGITVALIGFNTAFGTFAASLFVAFFLNGRTLVSVNINPYISDFILALMIWLSAITNYFIIFRPHDKWLDWSEGKTGFPIKMRKKAKIDSTTGKSVDDVKVIANESATIKQHIYTLDSTAVLPETRMLQNKYNIQPVDETINFKLKQDYDTLEFTVLEKGVKLDKKAHWHKTDAKTKGHHKQVIRGVIPNIEYIVYFRKNGVVQDQITFYAYDKELINAIKQNTQEMKVGAK